MLTGTSQLGRRGRLNTYETTGNNSPVLSNKVEQDFKGINDESDLETEGRGVLTNQHLVWAREEGPSQRRELGTRGAGVYRSAASEGRFTPSLSSAPSPAS